MEHTILPRILGAVTTAMVTWVCLWLESNLNLHVTADERNALISLLVGFGLALYSYVHRYLSRTMNPTDKALKAPRPVVSAKRRPRKRRPTKKDVTP